MGMKYSLSRNNPVRRASRNHSNRTPNKGAGAGARAGGHPTG
jgi:hypothetical protein